MGSNWHALPILAKRAIFFSSLLCVWKIEIYWVAAKIKSFSLFCVPYHVYCFIHTHQKNRWYRERVNLWLVVGIFQGLFLQCYFYNLSEDPQCQEKSIIWLRFDSLVKSTITGWLLSVSFIEFYFKRPFLRKAVPFPSLSTDDYSSKSTTSRL